jgi:hypothetical protein
MRQVPGTDSTNATDETASWPGDQHLVLVKKKGLLSFCPQLRFANSSLNETEHNEAEGKVLDLLPRHRFEVLYTTVRRIETSKVDNSKRLKQLSYVGYLA